MRLVISMTENDEQAKRAREKKTRWHNQRDITPTAALARHVVLLARGRDAFSCGPWIVIKCLGASLISSRRQFGGLVVVIEMILLLLMSKIKPQALIGRTAGKMRVVSEL